MLNTATGGAWTAQTRPNPAARLRLFCFPYAGGGASLFREWADEVPGNVDVCPVQLPGRERRMAEDPFTRMEPLREALAEGLRPLLDLPFAFFGHSMGALIAFEVARELRRSGGPQPTRLFASGCRAPHLPEIQPPTHHLPEAAFLEEIRRMGGMPRELLDAPELLELLLPVLRADMELCETYEHAPGPTLECPVTVFGGQEDPEVPAGDLDSWSELTTGECRVQLFPGDHFFLQTGAPVFLRTLRQELAGVLRSL